MASLSGYGLEYEKKVGAKRATSLAEIAGVALPRMGYQVTLAETVDKYGFRARLYLMNVSGQFVLASSSRPVVDWGRVFRQCFKEEVTA